MYKEMEVWRPCLQRGPGAEPLAFATVTLKAAWYQLFFGHTPDTAGPSHPSLFCGLNCTFTLRQMNL